LRPIQTCRPRFDEAVQFVKTQHRALTGSDPETGTQEQLDRLAALAQAYDVPLASLMVSDDALIAVVRMLEHATNRQLDAFTQLLQRAIDEVSDGAAA
jgi:hypothetical protein